LTDFDEIWYDDATWTSPPDGKPKISKFQNPRWPTAAILKVEKSRYLRNRLAILTKFCMTAHDRAYATMSVSVCLSICLYSIAYQRFKNQTFTAVGRHFENCYYESMQKWTEYLTISQQPFVRFW